MTADTAPVPKTETPPRMCKCGRGPWRKGQRNCAHCNREAYYKFKDRLNEAKT